MATKKSASRQAVKRRAGQTRNRVQAWEDDPDSGAPLIQEPVPELAKKPYPLKITGTTPSPKIYDEGTFKFRYWAAADALRRGAEFWSGIVPSGTTWQPGGTLPVTLDKGTDLNAYYDRHGLSFFHASTSFGTVYSGESPDILCHELGHAVLDSVRPQLWDAAADEVAAFHESFGDMSAILADLQLQPFRIAVLQDTEGHLYRNSRLSRLAEQLGRAIRERRPDAVDRDCLRNAVNSFFYRAPDTVPPDGPASILTSEPHSFSRVFTGGFFQALAGMLNTKSKTPKEADLATVSRDAGALLLDAVRGAPVVPDYYSQIAAGMIQADASRFRGRYGEALKSAFVQRGLLSISSVASISGAHAVPPPRLRRAPTGASFADVSASLPKLALAGEQYGLGARPLFISAPGQPRRFQAAAAALDVGAAASPSSEKAARSFVEDLFRRGRVDVTSRVRIRAEVVNPLVRKTHELVEETGSLTLRRRCFGCGFD